MSQKSPVIRTWTEGDTERSIVRLPSTGAQRLARTARIIGSLLVLAALIGYFVLIAVRPDLDPSAACHKVGGVYLLKSGICMGGSGR